MGLGIGCGLSFYLKGVEMDVPDVPCSICCHETRNAILSVVYFAKEAKKTAPDVDTTMLDAAITRLENMLKRCAQ